MRKTAQKSRSTRNGTPTKKAKQLGRFVQPAGQPSDTESESPVRSRPEKLMDEAPADRAERLATVGEVAEDDATHESTNLNYRLGRFANRTIVTVIT